MTLGCKALFGEQRAAEIRELVERSTGEPCPCLQGRRCPLLPLAQVPEQHRATALALAANA